MESVWTTETRVLERYVDAALNPTTTISKHKTSIGYQVVEKMDGTHLYSTSVEVDDDALEEYWVNIRKKPTYKHVKNFNAPGKH